MLTGKRYYDSYDADCKCWVDEFDINKIHDVSYKKSEIKQLTKEISQQTDCIIGPWCDDCKHLKCSTLPNEQQTIKNILCKEWEGK